VNYDNLWIFPTSIRSIKIDLGTFPLPTFNNFKYEIIPFGDSHSFQVRDTIFILPLKKSEKDNRLLVYLECEKIENLKKSGNFQFIKPICCGKYLLESPSGNFVVDQLLFLMQPSGRLPFYHFDIASKSLEYSKNMYCLYASDSAYGKIQNKNKGDGHITLNTLRIYD
jgi:hypothetical protein